MLRGRTLLSLEVRSATNDLQVRGRNGEELAMYLQDEMMDDHEGDERTGTSAARGAAVDVGVGRADTEGGKELEDRRSALVERDEL